jgi:hypothetical protein
MKGAFNRATELRSDRASVCALVAEGPDLHTQLEDLFDEVWRDEADWTMNDRIDLALRPSGMRSR